MHLPDAYLSPATQAATMLVAVPAVWIAARKTQKSLSSRQVPLLSVGAAFCFAVQMFNIPAVGGTTAHALGTALLAILLGPWAALLTMTLNLTVQALFFGDGGILSLGANVIDMAIIPSFVGSALYRSLGGGVSSQFSRKLMAAGVASYTGTSLASLSAGFLLGLQPLVAHDAAGHATYFPFGWSVSIPAMLLSHLLVAAPAEAIITTAALAYLWKNFPDLCLDDRRVRTGSGLRLSRTVGFALLATPLGLIAAGSAWGEWKPDELRRMVGYVPAGVAHGQTLSHPILPDYAFTGRHGLGWDLVGTVVSALVGAGIVALAIRSLLRRAKPQAAKAELGASPSFMLPAFLGTQNPLMPSEKASSTSWIDALLLRMRNAVEETVACENVARANGWMQRLPGCVKAFGTLTAIVLVSFCHSTAVLAAVFLSVVCIAASSRVPVKAFLVRVLGSVLFFGAIVALPLCFEAVTPGERLLELGAASVSRPGVAAAATLALRLGCGIGLTMLWTLTTRWHEMIRSIRRLGVPAMFCTSVTLAYRYLFVAVSQLEEMAIARRSRQIGQMNKAQAREYSGAGAAILFAKSYAFTDEVHMAMKSRCYEVTPDVVKRTKPRPHRGLSIFASIFGGLLS